MKIYYLSSTYFSAIEMNVLKHLSTLFEVTYGVIIPHTNSNFTEEELNQYCDSHGINFSPFHLRYRFRDLRVILSYYSIINDIKSKKPDIIYFVNFDNLYLNTILLLLNPSKTIVAFHDVENHSGISFNYFNNLSKKLLIRNFKYFHTFSTIQQSLLKAMVYDKIVYNISLPLVDFGRVNSVKKNEGIINFLFFGNIGYYKGLDILISAFNNIAAKYPNAYLIIAGRCIDWNEKYLPLIQNSSQIKTNIGFIDNDDIPTFFSEADYVVLPYRDTTQSGPLMISYNYNVPVLVSDAEGFKEFTSDDITGYSFKINDSNSLENLLEICIKRPESEYKQIKQSLALYTKNNFSITTILNKYDSMFNSILSNKKFT